MTMHDPPYPGEVLRELYLEPLGLTVTRAAQALRVSRKTLSAVLSGHAGISPEMAVRLAAGFGTSAELWLNLQQQFDLAKARASLDVSQVEPLHAAQMRIRGPRAA
jgi:addiction module HigA family antidote